MDRVVTKLLHKHGNEYKDQLGSATFKIGIQAIKKKWRAAVPNTKKRQKILYPLNFVGATSFREIKRCSLLTSDTARCEQAL